MRKEKLLEKKQAAIQEAPWYVKMIMDDSDLKQFSVAQIELPRSWRGQKKKEKLAFRFILYQKMRYCRNQRTESLTLKTLAKSARKAKKKCYRAQQVKFTNYI